MRTKLGVLCVSAVIALSACSANPGPPPVVQEEDKDSSANSTATSTTPAPEEEPAQTRSTVAIGVDPLRGGLNPHLVANNSELVSQISDLVLPSAFHGEQMDSDVLESAEEIPAPEGVVQRVRYTIASPAQWSDGTPISGADFDYLWKHVSATAGVNNAAGYRAISAVRTTEGGRVVTVDFKERLAEWKLLFNDLLPSHLLENDDFNSALSNGIPASAGRYLVENVDRGRGVITLNRNDRFWGQDPAQIDVIQLRSVRDSTQAVNMLRSGQVGFVDLTPQQTSLEALGLLDGVTAAPLTRPRQLRLHLSAQPGALPEEGERRALASYIDTSQVARLSSGRASELKPGANPVSGDVDHLPLRERAGRQPIRIAADPTDALGLQAAHVIVDVLAEQGIDAEVVSERLTTITSDLLPNSRVDGVITWEDTAVNSISLASLFDCAKQQPLAGDLSGYCPADAAKEKVDILSGQVSTESAQKTAQDLNSAQVLYVPLFDEVRVHALGRGIVGPGQSIEDWEQGLVTAPSWRIDEE